MVERTWTETMQVQAQDLTAWVDALITEGNVRRIVLKREGHTMFEIPLTAGMAVGAVAAFVTQCTLEIERAEEMPEDAPVPPSESSTATMTPPPRGARDDSVATHPLA